MENKGYAIRFNIDGVPRMIEIPFAKCIGIYQWTRIMLLTEFLEENYELDGVNKTLKLQTMYDIANYIIDKYEDKYGWSESEAISEMVKLGCLKPKAE